MRKTAAIALLVISPATATVRISRSLLPLPPSSGVNVTISPNASQNDELGKGECTAPGYVGGQIASFLAFTVGAIAFVIAFWSTFGPTDHYSHAIGRSVVTMVLLEVASKLVDNEEFLIHLRVLVVPGVLFLCYISNWVCQSLMLRNVSLKMSC